VWLNIREDMLQSCSYNFYPITPTCNCIYRDHTHDFVYNSTKVMRGNATKSWKLAAILDFAAILIFLSDCLTLGPKLLSRPLPWNWYWKRKLCIKWKWKHKNAYVHPPLLGHCNKILLDDNSRLKCQFSSDHALQLSQHSPGFLK